MRRSSTLAAWVLLLPACAGEPGPAAPDDAQPASPDSATATPGHSGRGLRPGPAAPAARVVLALGTSVQSEARPRELQRTVYEALRRFGLRVDCLTPFRDPALEAAAKAESAAADPDAPVALRITGQAGAEYADSAFYGQPLAHNFHGQVDVQVADGEGQPLRRVAFGHSWGRLRQSRSLEGTLADWEDAVHTTVLVGIFTHEAVQAAVPAERREELARWIEGERRRVLDRLERSIAESEVVAALEGYAPD